jgi:uncharacterized membrane protein YvbJ
VRRRQASTRGACVKVSCQRRGGGKSGTRDDQEVVGPNAKQTGRAAQPNSELVQARKEINFSRRRSLVETPRKGLPSCE